ncbi:hypothetical protein NKH75_19125 [Mesorhizobium sp. M0984]|uniref:hypothetical protein n=1 Tax=Mesorhizobium sp. M0984 TaxID=2957041 RepID=UPI00333B98E1
MSFKKIALLTLIAAAFAASFLGIIVARKGQSNARRTNPPEALKPFDGKFAIRSIDDLRVGGRRIVLCGVAFSKPLFMRAMMEEAARRDYQGLSLTCKPVGTGTPCDGNIAPKFNGAVVVQCFVPDGTDLAVKLVEGGILCGQPAQAGSVYKPCLPGS